MRGYFLFTAIFCLISSVAVLTNGHWLALFLLVLFFLRLCATKKKQLIVGTLILTGMVTLATSIHQWTNKTNLNPKDTTFTVRVKPDQIKVDGDQLQFYGMIQNSTNNPKLSEKIITFYTIQSKTEKKMWQSQVRSFDIKVIGNLEQPAVNRNQNQFNYQAFLYRKRIHWILKANEIQLIKKPEASMIEKMMPGNMRAAMLKHIDKSMSKKVSQYMKTLLFADLGSLDKLTVQNFKEIGIVHLLSISGLHIQFFLTGLVYLFWRIGITKEVTFYLMMVILPFYGNLTGWGTSVYRAIVMSLIVLIGSHFRKPISSLDIWSWTLLSAIIINPYQIFSIGFQLIYLLSLALLILSQSFFNTSRPLLATSFVISFILMLISIPILSYHFFEFSWIGIFANLLFVPLFTWMLLPIFIILLILSFFVHSSLILNYVLISVENLLTVIEKTVESISKLPFITIVTGRVPLIFTMMLVLSLIYFILTLEMDRKYKNKRLFSMSLLMIALIFFSCYQRYSPFDEVMLLDVGQGDAIVVKKSFGKGTYLIDTGGSLNFPTKDWQKKENPSSIAERVLIPVLKSQGLSSLDQVFITHGDEDHCGALLELSKSIRVKELLFPVGTTNKLSFRKTVIEMANSGTNVHEVLASGKKSKSVNSTLAVLWPFSPGKGENNDSMVLYGKIGSLFWLFTGDIEEEGEKSLIQQYPHLKVDILKVAHHGSQTSSNQAFLDFIHPNIALISCGVNNRYNHPNPDVLSRIQNKNIFVYRTDSDGAIHFKYLEVGGKTYQESFYTLLKRKN